jgi:hypothetical protein
MLNHWKIPTEAGAVRPVRTNGPLNGAMSGEGKHAGAAVAVCSTTSVFSRARGFLLFFIHAPNMKCRCSVPSVNAEESGYRFATMEPERIRAPSTTRGDDGDAKHVPSGPEPRHCGAPQAPQTAATDADLSRHSLE